MKKYSQWQARGHVADGLIEILQNNGFKKSWLWPITKKLFSEGVSVKYTYDQYGPYGTEHTIDSATTEVVLKASSSEKALPVYRVIRDYVINNCGWVNSQEEPELFKLSN